MSVVEAFAATLKNLRIKCGMSQQELAFESGLDRTFISLLERGKRQPTLTTLFQLSKALGVMPDEMLRIVMQYVEISVKVDNLDTE